LDQAAAGRRVRRLLPIQPPSIVNEKRYRDSSLLRRVHFKNPQRNRSGLRNCIGLSMRTSRNLMLPTLQRGQRATVLASDSFESESYGARPGGPCPQYAAPPKSRAGRRGVWGRRRFAAEFRRRHGREGHTPKCRRAPFGRRREIPRGTKTACEAHLRDARTHRQTSPRVQLVNLV
jgi:hypothetical protein